MKIDINIENYKCFPREHPANLSLENGFVSILGANNVGKSALLKFFYEFRQLFALASMGPGELIKLMAGMKAINLPPESPDGNSLFSHDGGDILKLVIKVSNNVTKPNLGYINKLVIEIYKNKSFNNLSVRGGLFSDDQGVYVNLDGLSIMPSAKASGTESIEVSNLDYWVNDILEMARELENTFYVGPYRNILNSQTERAYYDMQIGKAFVAQWSANKLGLDSEKNAICFDVTEDIKNIFGFDRLEINPEHGGGSLRVVIDKKSYSLDQVGAGLAEFIMILGSVAFKKPSYVLIDEPESHLHPAMQTRFVTALGGYAKKGVIFATHSMGLARTVSESIYSIRKVSSGISKIQPYDVDPHLAEMLGELSYSAYQELGYEILLLVEGPTEIKTFQQWLRKLGLDGHVFLLPIFGAGYINGKRKHELEELKRICRNIAVIIDSEKKSQDEELDSNRKKFIRICEEIDIRLHITARRATENYFTQRSLDESGVARGVKELGWYDKLGCSPEKQWDKNKNWQIASKMTIEEI